MVAAAASHTSLVAWVWFHAADPALYGWMRLDAASLLFLSIASLLFLIVSVYAVGYLRDQSHSRARHSKTGTGSRGIVTRTT